MTLKSTLALHGLELSVFLGWPQEERLQEQTVLLDITLQFPQPPKACQTDNLKDTYCYDSLVNVIRKNFCAQKFHLIEHLTYRIYHLIKQLLPLGTLVTIRVIKQPSAITNLNGGIAFCYGDEHVI